MIAPSLARVWPSITKLDDVFAVYLEPSNVMIGSLAAVVIHVLLK